MNRLTKDQLAFAHHLQEFASEIRGKFLNAATWMDGLLADILATYFCQNRHRWSLFFSEIAVEMRLSAKAALLDKILRRDFPNLNAAYPTLKKRLDNFRAFRNRLAHSHIDTSEAALIAHKPDEVTFIFYEDGETKRHHVTSAEVETRGHEVDQLREDLARIQRDIAGTS